MNFLLFSLSFHILIVLGYTDSCPDGWTMFKRHSGFRCLKAFTSAPIPRMEAENLCRNQNSLLAGLENREEGLWINAQFLPLRPNTATFKTVWIGALRKLECWNIKSYQPSCYPAATNMFSWTDGSVAGTDGFGPWWDNNPDNGNGTKPIQPCVMLTIQSEPVGNNIYKSQPASLNDVSCEGRGDYIMGYVCSKVSIKLVQNGL